MKLCINLNEEIKFKLTDLGLDIWVKYLGDLLETVNDINYSLHFDIKEQIKFLHRSHQKKEFVSMQLHVFMRVFGSHMNLGGPPPIQDLEIFMDI